MTQLSGGSAAQSLLWHPRYWPTWLGLLLLFLFSLLPFEIKQRFGFRLGILLYRIVRSRARVTRQNLRACFPERSDEEINRIARATFVEVCKGFMASLHLWSHSLHTVTRRANVSGLEHLREAQRRGRGILLIGGHYAPTDLFVPLILSQVKKPGYMYRKNDNPVVEWMIERGRRRHFKVRAFNKFETPDMVAFLKEGGQVWFACDQDFNEKTRHFVPFFGVDAPCIDAPTRIQRASGATVVFVGHCRTTDGQYEVTFSPIQEAFGRDPVLDAKAWNQFIQNMVASRPEQYYWLHKRFKTRPEGAPSIY